MTDRDPHIPQQSRVEDAIDTFLREQEEQQLFHEEMKQLLGGLVAPQDEKDDKK